MLKRLFLVHVYNAQIRQGTLAGIRVRDEILGHIMRLSASELG